jgi:hypothetical protein
VRQQLPHGLHIAGAVTQNVGALVGGERPTFHNAVPHGVFVFAADAVETKIGERAEQTFARRHRAAIHDATECGTEVEDIDRQRPALREMAAELGVADEADKQRVVVYQVRRGGAELVAPQALDLPGWPFLPRQADHVGPLSRSRDEFGIGGDDAPIVTYLFCLGPPTF